MPSKESWAAVWEWTTRNLANIAILAALLLTVPALLLTEPQVSAESQSPAAYLTEKCGFQEPAADVSPPVDIEVADASPDYGLNLVLPRSGEVRVARTGQLAVSGDTALTPGAVLTTDVSDLRRDDGETIPPSQVRSRAVVDRTGASVSVHVCVAPRLGSVSAAGGYTGAVALDDPRARGATVPVEVHIQYPLVDRAVVVAILAAVAGLIWTWLIRHTDKAVDAEVSDESSWHTLATRLASLLAAVPVLVALVFENPDWQGSIGAYVALATAVGGAVIAAAPTFRALASRVNTS